MTVDLEFEAAFEKFYEEQLRSATGRRLDLMKKDKEGVKQLLKVIVWPIFKSFDGFVLQYEMVSVLGITMYIDIFYIPLSTAFECEGFVAHAETITRDRFDFEKLRVRVMGNKGNIYYPYTWDEMKKKPEACKSQLLELIGKHSSMPIGNHELSLYEREVIRNGFALNSGFRLTDVCAWLDKGEDFSRKIVRSLIAKKLIAPTGQSNLRYHEYKLTEDAVQLVLKRRL